MDDIGNIVYLIMILISVIAGVVNKWNKKEQGKMPAPIPDVDYTPESVEEIEPVPSDPKAEKRLAEMEAKAKEALRAHEERRKKRRKSHLKEFDPDNETNNLTSEFDPREFDARKAVIYSEILKPPYL